MKGKSFEMQGEAGGFSASTFGGNTSKSGEAGRPELFIT